MCVCVEQKNSNPPFAVVQVLNPLIRWGWNLKLFEPLKFRNLLILCVAMFANPYCKPAATEICARIGRMSSTIVSVLCTYTLAHTRRGSKGGPPSHRGHLVVSRMHTRMFGIKETTTTTTLPLRLRLGADFPPSPRNLFPSMDLNPFSRAKSHAHHPPLVYNSLPNRT